MLSFVKTALLDRPSEGTDAPLGQLSSAAKTQETIEKEKLLKKPYTYFYILLLLLDRW